MASTAIPIYGQQETFYVPGVQLKVRGKALGRDIIDDILQVTYKDKVGEIDTFQIEINNWDAGKRTFKFAPAMSAEFKNIFVPGTDVELWMGYGDVSNMRLMMVGEITTLAPDFPQSGAPTLQVSGLNQIHQLRGEQHTHSWTKTRDTDIAIELGKKPVKPGQPGLGIPVTSNPAPNETAEEFVFMNSQYDIVFLLERARRNGYEIYLKENAVTHNKSLYFGLSQSKANVPVYRLEWGLSLLSFRPTLSTARQVNQVTVLGWDRTANKKIEVKYTLQNLWKDQGRSQAEIAHRALIARSYANRTEVVTKPPVRSVAEARKLARATLEDQNNRVVEATASTIGLPDVRAGCNVEIVGFSAPPRPDDKVQDTGSFDGRYYVTESTHTIGDGGYRTDFSARLDGQLAGTPPPKG